MSQSWRKHRRLQNCTQAEKVSPCGFIELFCPHLKSVKCYKQSAIVLCMRAGQPPVLQEQETVCMHFSTILHHQ